MFTQEKRERFLELLDEGHTVAQACVAVGVSRTTVNRWDRLGIEGANPDAVEFSRRYGAGRERRASAAHRSGSSNRFTPEKRMAFLIAIAAGRTLAQACDAVGVSSVTVQTWDARGKAGSDAAAAAFAQGYAAALGARPDPAPDPQLQLTADAGDEPVAPASASAPAAGEPRDGEPAAAAVIQPRSSVAAAPPLTEEELIRLLERQARRGVVGAMKLLLERPWERRDDGANDDTNAEPVDPFDDAPIDFEAERRRRAQA